MAILSFLYNGDQVGLAYSKCGLTKVLNNVTNISLSINVKDLKIRPKILLAFEIFCSKVSIIHALDGSISSFSIIANSILQQNL